MFSTSLARRLIRTALVGFCGGCAGWPRSRESKREKTCKAEKRGASRRSRSRSQWSHCTALLLQLHRVVVMKVCMLALMSLLSPLLPPSVAAFCYVSALFLSFVRTRSVQRETRTKTPEHSGLGSLQRARGGRTKNKRQREALGHQPCAHTHAHIHLHCILIHIFLFPSDIEPCRRRDAVASLSQPIATSRCRGPRNRPMSRSRSRSDARRSDNHQQQRTSRAQCRQENMALHSARHQNHHSPHRGQRTRTGHTQQQRQSQPKPPARRLSLPLCARMRRQRPPQQP